MTEAQISEVNPGLLLGESLEELNITPYRLAKSIGIGQAAVSEILHGRRAITAETGLLLDCFFGTTPGYWHRLQCSCDMWKARLKMADRLANVVPLASLARPVP